MKSDILKHLAKKPTLDEMYARIESEDLISKKIDLLLQENVKTCDIK